MRRKGNYGYGGTPQVVFYYNWEPEAQKKAITALKPQLVFY